MIHEIHYDNEKKFMAHRLTFGYATDPSDGLPGDQGAAGYLDVEVYMDQHDDGAANFREARLFLWRLAVSAQGAKQGELRKVWKIVANQAAADERPNRDFEFQGWVQSFSDTSQQGPMASGAEFVRARIFVRPQRNDYTPSVT